MYLHAAMSVLIHIHHEASFHSQIHTAAAGWPFALWHTLSSVRHMTSCGGRGGGYNWKGRKTMRFRFEQSFRRSRGCIIADIDWSSSFVRGSGAHITDPISVQRTGWFPLGSSTNSLHYYFLTPSLPNKFLTLFPSKVRVSGNLFEIPAFPKQSETVTHRLSQTTSHGLLKTFLCAKMIWRSFLLRNFCYLLKLVDKKWANGKQFCHDIQSNEPFYNEFCLIALETYTVFCLHFHGDVLRSVWNQNL